MDHEKEQIVIYQSGDGQTQVDVRQFGCRKHRWQSYLIKIAILSDCI